MNSKKLPGPVSNRNNVFAYSILKLITNLAEQSLNKSVLFSVFIVFFSTSFGQINKITSYSTILENNGFFSSAPRGPESNTVYQRTSYLIKKSEILRANLPDSIVINSLGFNIYSSGISGTSRGKIRIFLENTEDSVYNNGSNWNTITSEMTLVHNDSAFIPSKSGFFDIEFTSLQKFIYTGNGLYIAFEWIQSSAPSLNTIKYFVNNTMTEGLVYNTSNSVLPPLLVNISNSRPETRITYTLVNDASVEAVYTLGKLPISFSNQHTISAAIKNNGDNKLSNINVSMEISGANIFFDQQVIPFLAAGETGVVSFSPFYPDSVGTNIINVYLNDDNNNLNNSKTVAQQVSVNDFISAASTGTFSNSLGFVNEPGAISVRYTTNENTRIDSLRFFITNGIGSIVKGIAFNSAGSVIAETDYYLIQPADSGNFITFPFKITPFVSNQDIFVGIAINSAGGFPVALQKEVPTRRNTFFSSNINGGAGSFRDLADQNFGIPVIEAHLISFDTALVNPLNGINIPGSFNEWTNPPVKKAFAGFQNSNGTFLPPEWQKDANTLNTRIYSTIINIRQSGGDTSAGNYQFLFTSGGVSNYSEYKWGGTNVSFNSIQYYLLNNNFNNSVNLSNGFYYCLNLLDNGYDNTRGIWMQISSIPTDITFVMNEHLPAAGVDNPVLIFLKKHPSSEEKIYLRYTKDNWNTWNIIQAQMIDSIIYKCTIPGTDVTTNEIQNRYYVFTSTLNIAELQSFTSQTDIDLAVIKAANNHGVNYSLSNHTLPVNILSFISTTDGQNVTLTWSTTSEQFNEGFELERRSGENNWKSIAFIPGKDYSFHNQYSFIDKALNSSEYEYRLKQIRSDGGFIYSQTISATIGVPAKFDVLQNYPNPFNPSTMIKYQTTTYADVNLELFDITGQKVTTLKELNISPGYHSFFINSSVISNLSSGVYIYRITASELISKKTMSIARKMLYLK